MDSGASAFASGPSPDGDGPGAASQAPQQHKQKRIRILLSCGPCRVSKLKCDRASPCKQCVRKGLAPGECVYAPPPTRRHGRNGSRVGGGGGGAAGAGAGAPAAGPKGVAGRLRRLERMVRDLMESGSDGDGNGGLAAALQELEASRQAAANGSGDKEAQGDDSHCGQDSDDAAAEKAKPSELLGAENRGQVVQGERATTWVGATHFMAMLDDIEDLKAYFDDAEECDEDQSPEAGGGGAFASEPQTTTTTDMLMLGRAAGPPQSRQDLLDLVPPRAVLDRLVMVFFTVNSPSAHTVHRPSFVRRYNAFWADPDSAPLEWLALLFLVLCVAVHHSSFAAPHELAALGVVGGDGDGPDAALRLLRQYRAAAGWALVASRYTSPSLCTLTAFMMYVESEFMLPNHSNMACYLLSGVSVRLMLKLGLHRDPVKLGGGITPFEIELRRRLWNMSSQIDMLVSFHVGLPSMILGIESDTEMPRNLTDDDLGEDMAELPPPRPDSDYTNMTYPIWKGAISRVFGHAARLAHSLEAPPLAEVARVDALLDDVWRRMPHFMKARPLAELVAEPQTRIVQRYALTQHYRKAQCVLHRRYLAEPRARAVGVDEEQRQKERSRRACLDGALAMLGFQRTAYYATRPTGILHRAWYMSPVARHDYLLGAAIAYVAVQNGHYRDKEDSEDGGGGLESNGPAATTTAAGHGEGVSLQLPTKKTIIDALIESHRVWVLTAEEQPYARSTAEMLRVMVQKVCHAAGHPMPPPVDASLDRIQTKSVDVPWSMGMTWHQIEQQQQQQQHAPNWPISINAVPAGGHRNGQQTHQHPTGMGIMDPTPPLSDLSLADKNGGGSISSLLSRPISGSSTTMTDSSPGQQVPMTMQDLVPSSAVPMMMDGIGGGGELRNNIGTPPWMVPMDTEALDWTLVDDVIRANSENVNGWFTGPEQQQEPPLTDMDLGLDPQHWVR